jgi:hypothetical protein
VVEKLPRRVAFFPMRRFASAIFFAGVVTVVGASSCMSTTGHSCTSAHGTCLFIGAGGGGPACLMQASSSAQDCVSGSNGSSWVCCLEVEGGAPDGEADAEGGMTIAPTVDATTADVSSVDASEAAAPETGAGEAAVPDATLIGDAAVIDDATPD